MFTRLAFVCGLALSQSAAGYRVNVKKLMDVKARVEKSPESSPTAEASSLFETHADAATNATSSEPMRLVVKPFELMELDFLQTVNASQRSVGNLIASVGLVRARLALKAASWVVPASVADQVLPAAAFVQEVPAEADVPTANNWAYHAAKFFGFVGITGFILVSANSLLDVLVKNEKVLGNNGSVTPADVRECFIACTKIAIPQILVVMLYMINEIFSVIAIGRVGTTEELAAVGCCAMMMNAILMAFSFGILGPLDALVSTAWGAGDKVLCLSYVNKGRLVGLCQVVWILPAFWHAETILVALGQDPLVARHAASFCKVMGVMYVPFFFSLSTGWMLKNMGEPFVGVIGLFLGNFVHIGICTVLVVYGGWGNLGIAIAWASNQTVNGIVTIIYGVFISCCKDESYLRLFWIDLELCTGISDYMGLAIPSILAGGSESWYWEGITMIVGTMSPTVLAAHVAAANIQGVLMMAPSGLFSAATTIVGQLMGAGKTGLLNAMFKLFPLLASIIWACIFTFICFYVNEVVSFFVIDPEVQYIMVRLLAFCAVAGFFNVSQAVTGGCLRGMAQHRTVAWLVLSNYYLVSFPMAYMLGIKFGFGVYGVYFSFNTGLILMFICLTYKLHKVDLEVESKKACERMEVGKANAGKATNGKANKEEISVK